ncbi:MAG TPA: M28 family peptidase, partial [Isosphaeraceae bacterium]|nr:M28 family peptidase [Isosphaeraceae bacterium]
SRVLRDEAELPITTREDKLAHVLFSTRPEDVGLYGKPMARNVQIWTDDFQLLLDGPNATSTQIEHAAQALSEGGLFGYRLHFPAMQVGQHEVYWHRPLVAYLSHETDRPQVLPNAPLGYLTAYRADRIDVDRPVELWPRLLRREEYLAAIHLFEHAPDPRPRRTTLNIHALLHAYDLMGGRPLPRSFARDLLTISKEQSIDDWLEALPGHASDAARGQRLAEELSRRIEPEQGGSSRRMKHPLPGALTYAHTAKRSFEVAFWNTIVALSHGHYLTKNNADCALDPATQAALRHHHRDLDPLGSYLIEHYQRTIAGAGMAGKAMVGDLPFHWQTDFPFDWSDGWLRNQEGPPRERDIIVVIPGRNRRHAVIMADHYDTAYMADHYEKESGGNGARIAAPGADDNCSATAALMLGAPVFLALSRAGKLGCDVWLVHLTGEEFPADCLGARHLSQCLVEGTLAMRLPDGRRRELADTRVQGVFVLDMIAHNSDHERDIFQIAPGTSREAMRLAYEAHLANEIWNDSTEAWNRRPSRKACGRAQRRRRGLNVPDIARHLPLAGEVRPHFSPRSTLYNTDGQIFSDAGIPGVLFMENYDINRTGYHDSRDTMANIDLDYGAALAAITIETVARAASETRSSGKIPSEPGARS